MELKRVVIVGSGNVAEALARALPASGAELCQVFARNRERGPRVAALGGTTWTADPDRLVEADLYLIAVSDRAVGEVAASLRLPDGAVAAHTAGSVPLDALEAFPRRAVIYPLQTFTAGRAVDFARVPLFLEASDKGTYQAVERFARRLSSQLYPADSKRRGILHLAGVLACNFVNALYAAGERTLAREGLPFEALRPLIAETAAKALAAPSPAAVQTGPAVRGDLPTLERHRVLLAEEPLLLEIYNLMSRYIWETSRKI
ncbi:Rossmann-like and DUF2520 domain-containing protein [uncultured Alistipes sp.]|uniref:Rossmann-like and DUF2520 domain-containing protein n=1 Tax=uncultured Alistipes sp. TaxID=538949 RepID=UPI00349F5967